MITEVKDRDPMPIWEKILVLCVFTISMSSLYVAIFTSFARKHDSTTETNITEHFVDPSIAENMSIISRKEWGAIQPSGQLNLLKQLPPSYVIISHTSTSPCLTKIRCTKIIQMIQAYHIKSKGWPDIAYNFIVGGDGLVYEGRGWNIEGAHTYNYNYKSIGISLIGNFIFEEPTRAQLLATEKLIDYGLMHGKIDKNYKLLGQRQCVKTESPDDILYDIIKTWKHWSSNL